MVSLLPQAFYLAVLGKGGQAWLYDPETRNRLQWLPIEILEAIESFFLRAYWKGAHRTLSNRASLLARRLWPRVDAYSDPVLWDVERRERRSVNLGFSCACRTIVSRPKGKDMADRTKYNNITRRLIRRYPTNTFCQLPEYFLDCPDCRFAGNEHWSGNKCKISRIRWTFCTLGNVISVFVRCYRGYLGCFTFSGFPHPGRETGDAETERAVWKQARAVEEEIQATLSKYYT